MAKPLSASRMAVWLNPILETNSLCEGRRAPGRNRPRRIRSNRLSIARSLTLSVSDLAMESLLDLIRRGLLRPGARLPSQRELVSRMGLSQTAIREALSGLAILQLETGR